MRGDGKGMMVQGKFCVRKDSLTLEQRPMNPQQLKRGTELNGGCCEVLPTYRRATSGSQAGHLAQ